MLISFLFPWTSAPGFHTRVQGWGDVLNFLLFSNRAMEQYICDALTVSFLRSGI